MILVYVAGPFRAANHWEQELNIRRAEGFALDIWRMGAACICPHTNTRYFQGAAPDEVWLEGDLEMVLRSDVVFMVPGWEKSVGALEERRTALHMGIPVVYTLEEVKCLVSNASSPFPSTKEPKEKQLILPLTGSSRPNSDVSEPDSRPLGLDFMPSISVVD